MNKQKNEVLYIAVSADIYEFVIYVCDAISDLARWAGTTTERIKQLINEPIMDTTNNCFYLRLVLQH